MGVAMLKGILVGLDGSPHADAATELGVRWAERFDALLVGLAVIDEPALTAPEATPLGGAYFKGEKDQEKLLEAHRRADGWLNRFSLRCSQAGVASKVLEDDGDPVDRFAAQAQRYDLVILGQKTCFRSGDPADPDDTLEGLLRRPPRPVVVVPETLPADGPTIVAYDGSPPSARALASYVASGLAAERQTVVVTVGSDFTEAARIADRAVDFLSLHGIAATAKPVAQSGGHGECVLAAADAANAGLLVMGAFGHSQLHDMLFGCTTKTVLRKAKVPVFLDH